jgi:hypothetical protein
MDMKKKPISEEGQKMASMIKEDKSKKSQPKPDVLVSKVSNSGVIVETVYDPREGKVGFAVYAEDKIELKSKLMLESEIYVPLSNKTKILQNGVVLFPSAALDFGDFQSLFQEVRKFIFKYVQVSEFYEIVSCYYVLLTWLFDGFQELPYLRVLGDYGSGKSRFLRVIGSLCYKPMFLTGATTVSPIFRLIDKFQGTLILDEADFVYSDTTNELVKILNGGFSRASSNVLRSESIQGSKSYDINTFDVFGPKILAGRRPFKDAALESRCLVEHMEKRTRKDIPLNLDEEFDRRATLLRNKLLMFRFQNRSKLTNNHSVVKDLEPRLNQIISPLLSIIPDDKVKGELIGFMMKYQKEIVDDRMSSDEGEVLAAIIDILDEAEQLTVKNITNRYNQDLASVETLSAKKIGVILRKNLKLKTERTRNGYVLVMDKGFKERLEVLRVKFGFIKREHVKVVKDDSKVSQSPQDQYQMVVDTFEVKEES